MSARPVQRKQRRLFEWRDAFRSESGPISSVTRHVLQELSNYMDNDSLDAFPSQKRIAAACRLTEKCVRDHLTDADNLGWIERKRFRAEGKKWSQYSYVGKIPATYPQQPEGRSGDASQRPESQVRQPEPHVRNDRNDVPINSSVNSLNNSVIKENQKDNFSKPPELWKTFLEKYKSTA